MNLLREVKSATKKPFSVKSFYIFFVAIFLVLIAPLTVLGIVHQGNMIRNANSNCAVPAEKSFSGNAGISRDGIHEFEFSGENCKFTAWVRWDGDGDLSLWVYEPTGNVHVIDGQKNKKFELFKVTDKSKAGKYRIAVKLVTGNSLNYTATVSFR